MSLTFTAWSGNSQLPASWVKEELGTINILSNELVPAYSSPTYYWTLSGSGINADDLLASGTLTGGVALNGSFGVAGLASEPKPFLASFQFNDDGISEGNETVTFSAYKDSARTQFEGSLTFEIREGASQPNRSITISTSSTTYSEGDSLRTTAQTSGVEQGAMLYWSLTGTNISSSDFGNTSLEGSGTVGADGTVTFQRTIADDNLSEGEETVDIKFFLDGGRTVQVGSTQSVTINDPTSTYSLTTSATSISEGDSLTTNIGTQNVGEGTTLYWKVIGLDAADLASGGLSGSGTTNSEGSFTINHSIKTDELTEGNEVFTIKLYTDSS